VKTLSIVSVLFAFAAAVLWGWSAFINVPVLKSGWGTLGCVMPDGTSVAGEGPFYAALKRISRLNAFAAACAAISALVQALTIFQSN